MPIVRPAAKRMEGPRVGMLGAMVCKEQAQKKSDRKEVMIRRVWCSFQICHPGLCLRGVAAGFTFTALSAPSR